MYKYIRIQGSIVLIVLLSSTTSIVNAEVRSNVKPIPKSFIGKWVGVNRTKQRATKAVIKDMCNDSYYNDDAYVVEFNADRQRLNTTLYLEDNFYESPISYTKYTTNHISGQSLTFVFELGSNNDLASKQVGKFDYKISNRELTLIYGSDTFYLTRCN